MTLPRCKHPLAPRLLADYWLEELTSSDEERTAARGGRMFGQAHAREFLSITGFEVKLPFDGLAGWKDLRRLSIDEQRRALEDPDRRRRLTDEALHGPYGNAIGAEARAPQFDTMRIVDRPQGPYRTVGELAAELTYHHRDDNPSLCCGLAGRAQALLSWHHHTGEPIWLRRANELARRARNSTNFNGPPLSLLRGPLGAALI